MDNRPTIEFVQTQCLPWRRIGPGLARPDVEYKMLSRNAETGACSILMRYPAGWSREGPEHIAAAEEFYVLEGSLQMDDQLYHADCYGFLPAGWTRQHMESRHGCVVLAFYDTEPHLIGAAGDGSAERSPRAIPFIDAAAMPWDMTLNDPKLKHLGISRKNLRTDPETHERTFLSLMLPHATPEGGKGPQETHPVVEEAYMIAGALTGPHGTMYPGAYFWRPPGIPHGPFGTRWGAVGLFRFVGGRHVNLWSSTVAPFTFDVPYQPVLPDHMKHLADLPWSPPPVY